LAISAIVIKTPSAVTTMPAILRILQLLVPASFHHHLYEPAVFLAYLSAARAPAPNTYKSGALERNQMPKAGPYEFPIRDLDSCIEYLRKADKNQVGESFTREEFGSLVEKSSKSGPFGALVGAMNQYGLVEARRGQIQLTELARRILFGQPDEANDAKKKAVLNIGLFTEICSEYGPQATNEDIRAFLGEHTKDAQDKAAEIGSVFRAVSHYIELDGKGNQTVVTEEKPQFGFEEYRLGGGIQVRLPKQEIHKAWKRTKKAMDTLLGTGE
jgi:hypothetical protein